MKLEKEPSAHSKCRPVMSELVFLDVSHPTRAHGADTQRLIRSHVTRQQHRKRRDGARGLQVDVHKALLGSENISPAVSTESQASKFPSEVAPATADTGQDQKNLAFVESNPSQATSSTTRKLVRSHVTKWQHRRRQQQAADPTSNDSESTPSSSTDTPAPEWRMPSLPTTVQRSYYRTEQLLYRTSYCKTLQMSSASASEGLGLGLPRHYGTRQTSSIGASLTSNIST